MVGCGTISALLLSRIGWSEYLLVDLILNQISVLMIILGIGIFLYQGELNPVGIVFTVIGLLLVGLGMHFHSSVSEDKLDNSSMH